MSNSLAVAGLMFLPCISPMETNHVNQTIVYECPNTVVTQKDQARLTPTEALCGPQKPVKAAKKAKRHHHHHRKKKRA